MAEQVKADAFEPPTHNLKPSIEAKLEALWKEYVSQFCTRWNLHWNNTFNRNDDRYRNLWANITKTLPNCHKILPMGKGWNRKAPYSKSDMRRWSNWSVPIIVVPKGDREKCLVIDYPALNKVMRKFIWPLHKVEDIYSQLNGTKYFSPLDLWAGYHHIPLDDASIPQTAFTSPFGKYEKS